MTTTTTVRLLSQADLHYAEEGSYYTILGAGGDLDDWVTGLTKILNDEEIGTPVAWYRTTGEAINRYTRPDRPQDRLRRRLTVLMFPLDGLDLGRLAIFRLRMEDQWFDDLVSHMRGES